MYPSGTGNPDTFDIDGLDAIGAKADVTLDFFLDPDKNQSTNVTNPAFEVMIWFAALDETEPIGTLFAGQNTQVDGMDNQPGQEVFSFVAPKNMTSFSQLNVLPLFQYLMDGGKMANSTYLGTAQFGTEAFHTDGKNVTKKHCDANQKQYSTDKKQYGINKKQYGTGKKQYGTSKRQYGTSEKQCGVTQRGGGYRMLLEFV
ncbi:hypothetical protein HO133_007701 [Letharia lupina]|uniref:Uncharacterized protein n=1 Tax=Letharia lupina TaxID=560253 RepID=A0A8H6FHE5_9LECA|nr:uncharacterized protein HO133_007701 [Letharia lupina]KAF6227973.1 hypothetical protein HO133_007701 [Letharia lupina]